jgi:hypothetical protein
MRKALIVGVNHYQTGLSLFGCVDDAYNMRASLERHSDGTINFGVKLLTATGPTDRVLRLQLKEAAKELFASDSEIALFYFAGHGNVEATGGHLLTSDSSAGDDGLSLHELMSLANGSKAKNKILILDSCHSGLAGASVSTPELAELKEGLTILTASTAEQYASEVNGSGVFTSLFVDALNGAACNLVGDVTPGSIYAHIDQSLGPWDQRPVFKTNVKSFVSLRKVQPPIPLSDLQQLAMIFPSPGYIIDLDPSYEPERSADQATLPRPDPKNVATFAILQKYNRVNLVVPVDAPHMWHAAMQSKRCKLTVLGEHYRKLVSQNRI